MEQITLFCLVYGVTPVEDRIFPIHISRNNTIAGLCDMIVEKWHDNYSGENLTLWKMKKIETKSGCFRLDNINQTVLNFIELSKVFPKEKFVDDLDEKENEKAINSLLIKKLANIVSSLYSRKNKDIFWNEYTFLFNERKRFSHTRFSYKTMIEELREMDFHISEDTLSKIYRHVSSPNKNSKKAIEAWVNKEKMIMWMQDYERYIAFKITMGLK
ncbi:hypothetical protein GLOIN_2v1782852 [Rhizophagus irregularis DAOM 181602=DAOM 197198]|uniref:Crinkler effector protein N-terminal domain-containing protein n=1 Tax=Rhizophagus irregularis (strain DAOM 181602 / DAOM 197198 / MUCL 43194) TaxID=747089 RepID=A0A2P4PGJ6_RHIID|nr:hypothetical protein GLOIN_2v1782852 [Rhizophagus irregularis DAOM 181602=DAOM 197198]POG64519.1 hypothetical protein GLOIN_2v1782852 [Rhizophagus irregularis DAOM 181602=DAOM 197198]|eukprot:XP_025171385.1 hypothetical protein GLOIN_2v1782852 [Rhizophagus irregularis DAOM 181602=DAOM 197198]